LRRIGEDDAQALIASLENNNVTLFELIYLTFNVSFTCRHPLIFTSNTIL